ncbi:MAG TPA: hypothetical protein VF064_09290 [Pyrinomonadaceae bacterium]
MNDGMVAAGRGAMGEGRTRGLLIAAASLALLWALAFLKGRAKSDLSN